MDAAKGEASEPQTGARAVLWDVIYGARSSNNNVVILEPWSDAVGVLRSVELEDVRALAKISHLKVSLPLDIADQLRDLIGQRIAVLRTDKDYRVRRVL